VQAAGRESKKIIHFLRNLKNGVDQRQLQRHVAIAKELFVDAATQLRLSTSENLPNV
jgi:hypothetical protein